MPGFKGDPMNSAVNRTIDDKGKHQPSVSIVIPIRNEETYITKCLQSVVEQDYSWEKIEILVVDGMSHDRSRELVAQFASRYPNIKLLDNPQRIVPRAMNVGIRRAKGDIIIRVDAHSYLEPDYVSQCITYLREMGADNVGGLMRARGENYIGQAIALATSSPFGIGGSRFHYSEKEQYVDTVYLGAYPREVFDRIGLFDEELVCNEDYELNYRLRASGGRIFCTPAIKSIYYCRDSFPKLWKQYFQYGFWKLRMIKKHPRSVLPRHLIAPIFVFTLISSGVLGLMSRLFAYIFLLAISSYGIVSLAFAFPIALRKGWQYFPILPIVFGSMHITWGLGFLWSLARGTLSWNRSF